MINYAKCLQEVERDRRERRLRRILFEVYNAAAKWWFSKRRGLWAFWASPLQAACTVSLCIFAFFYTFKACQLLVKAVWL